ncbi:hypothetical protein IV203_003317 [Nitzschia inconspicua]|uniref:Uncharacterized protein n=1 Tax=Nitzschia inconspicua TaxID=303405 RepID=A0A9K3L3A6_9STRA|nr:hypothetical protein IV203_003317 [Nitzschia inconspicua]
MQVWAWDIESRGRYSVPSDNLQLGTCLNNHPSNASLALERVKDIDRCNCPALHATKANNLAIPAIENRNGVDGGPSGLPIGATMREITPNINWDQENLALHYNPYRDNKRDGQTHSHISPGESLKAFPPTQAVDISTESDSDKSESNADSVEGRESLGRARHQRK